MTLVLAVASFCWFALAALRDDGAADGARGLACIAGVCWLANLINLIIFLALGQLKILKKLDQLKRHIASEDISNSMFENPSEPESNATQVVSSDTGESEVRLEKAS